MIELPNMDAALQAETVSRFRIDEVHPYSSGQDFVVARGTSRTLGPLALRYPRSTCIDDGIDEQIDAVELLRQEASILSYLSLNRIPVPKVFGLVEESGSACLALEFLHQDNSSLQMEEVGRLLRVVHELPPAIARTVAQTETTINETIVTLIERRRQRFATLEECNVVLPPKEHLLKILDAWPSRAALLHMDVRSENFAVMKGKIVGIFDWSNALIGDPWLDLLRAEEFGTTDDAFWQGYGTLSYRPSAPVEAIYRLHTVVMLCLLFTQLIPDKDSAENARCRLQTLSKELCQMT